MEWHETVFVVTCFVTNRRACIMGGVKYPKIQGKSFETRFDDDALSYRRTIFQVMSWYSTSEEEASQRTSNIRS